MRVAAFALLLVACGGSVTAPATGDGGAVSASLDAPCMTTADCAPGFYCPYFTTIFDGGTPHEEMHHCVIICDDDDGKAECAANGGVCVVAGSWPVCIPP